MKNWEIASAPEHSQLLDQLLDQGYEPFSAICIPQSEIEREYDGCGREISYKKIITAYTTIIWLKR